MVWFGVPADWINKSGMREPSSTKKVAEQKGTTTGSAKPTTDVSAGLKQLSIAFLTHIWEKESCIVTPVEPVYNMSDIVWPNGFQC